MNTYDKAIPIEKGTHNIFEDIGLPDSGTLLLKSKIIIEFRRLMHERGLSQEEAARLTGFKQPDLSNILRGKLRGYSTERLMHLLIGFEQDIDITVRPHAKRGEPGVITFQTVPA
jgi:predicted XRE-type DNA-binding protein